MSETIQIKTLTPLWTGDIDGKCSRIKETGIIGSLRWWYEALVRGLGGTACDPTDSNCQFNYEAYKKTGQIEDGFVLEKHDERDVCDVCKLFGCNGWKKQFTLRIENDVPLVNLNFLKELREVDINGISSLGLGWWYNKTYKSKRAFYSEDYFPVHVHSNSKYYDDHQIGDIFGYLLKFISKAGAIGAKTQNGFGVIETECENIDLKNGFDLISKSINGEKLENHAYSLNNYFSFDVSFPLNFYEKHRKDFENPITNKKTLETGQMLKYLTRISLKNDVDKVKNICDNFDEVESNSENRKYSQENNAKKIVARHLIGSDLEGNKRVSLIHFSNLWKSDDSYKMRIWGFVPDRIEFNNYTTEINKENLIEVLKEIIESNFDIDDFGPTLFREDILKEVLE